MNNNINKKELQVVFSPDLYDELKYVFRPEQLENIIYKPTVIDENRWLCSCGFESEMEMCPICGMEKNTALSKINAGYLSRHKKTRLERQTKSNTERKEKMASMIKTSGKSDKKKAKYGTLIGIAILAVALILSVFLLFNEKKPDEKPKNTTPDVTSETTVLNEETTISEENTETTPEETEKTEPVSAPVGAMVEGITLQLAERNDNVSTVAKGEFAKEVSGNSVCGGLVYAGEEYDYVAKNGISICDKQGKFVKAFSTENAKAITGDKNYIFYTDENGILKFASVDGKTVANTEAKANLIVAAFDNVFFADDSGLYSYSPKTNTKNTVYKGKISALNYVANKVFFSCENGLGMLDNIEGPVNIFCPNGANATSIHEMDGWIFYTTENGEMNIYYPEKASKFGRTYPGNMMSGEKFTAIIGFENNIYFRVTTGGENSWYKMTILFQDVTKLDVTTPELFVTQNGIYDGNLNFISVQ